MKNAPRLVSGCVFAAEGMSVEPTKTTTTGSIGSQSGHIKPVLRKPRLLDLFCGAGGCAVGYHRAGFDVVGVDLHTQPRYPFEFHQADALTFDLAGFDAIHASPPCQAHTALRTMPNARRHDSLIEPVRALLAASGLPYVIENVVGAPMAKQLLLCGTMFGLGSGDAELRRHRLFESSCLFFSPQCAHGTRDRVIGVYGGKARDRRRAVPTRDFEWPRCYEALGIDWMSRVELCQAIPPAYTEWIGRQLLAYIV